MSVGTWTIKQVKGDATYHVLAQFQILGEVHTVLDGVVSVELDHHVGNRLAGPSIPGNELGDDVEETRAH